MFQEKSENTSTATAKQPEKTQKEKTKDASQTNSLATIDYTQATTQEEQAIIMLNNLENENSASAFTENLESYYPGKYWMNSFAPKMFMDGGGRIIEKKEGSSHVIGDTTKDKEFMQNALTYSVNLKGAVGKDKNNDKEDVKLVAAKLNELGYKDVPKKCIDDGEWDDGLTTNIKDFQTLGKGDGYYARKNYKEDNYSTPNGIVGTDDATFKALFRNTNLSAIFMNRSAVNSKIKIGKTKIDGSVGKDKTNNVEDVKLVAELLVENDIENVPTICLEQGEWHDDLATCIGAFIPNATWIGHNGNNIKKLTKKRKSGGTLKRMDYDMSTQEHTSSESRSEYNAKLDKIQIEMGIEESSDYDIILEIANKAATDPEYFNELTKDLTVKLTNTSANRKDGDVTLSPVLEDRMKRFHKFMVATGLYSGNMRVNDGARNPKRAHRWSVEYQIEQNKYSKDVKSNLIKMFNDKTYHEGDFIKDIDGNLWAKKEHFYTYYGKNPNYKTKIEYNAAVKKAAEEEKAKELVITEIKEKKDEEKKEDPITGIFWTDVVDYVTEYTKNKRDENVENFRSSSRSYASEGYETGFINRLPSSKNISTSNHVGGEAIDVSKEAFILRTDAMIDLIGLRFGVIRSGGAGESWHFEMTGVEVTKENEKYLKKQETKKE